MTRREKFRKIVSYALYYGHGEAAKLLSRELAIVEPAGQDVPSLARLREAGVLTVAYVSVMELPAWATETQWLQPGDYLHVEGRAVRNEAFGTMMADLRSKRWRGILHHRIGRLLLHDGYDGIFMDTIGNVEWPSFPVEMKEEQTHAAEELVRELRLTFPGHLLLQNNGFGDLAERTAPYVDGYCWENPPVGLKGSEDWVRAVAEQLLRLQRAHNHRVLLLFEEKHAPDRGDIPLLRLVKEHDWLLYNAPDDYLSI